MVWRRPQARPYHPTGACPWFSFFRLGRKGTGQRNGWNESKIWVISTGVGPYGQPSETQAHRVHVVRSTVAQEPKKQLVLRFFVAAWEFALTWGIWAGVAKARSSLGPGELVLAAMIAPMVVTLGWLAGCKSASAPKWKKESMTLQIYKLRSVEKEKREDS